MLDGVRDDGRPPAEPQMKQENPNDAIRRQILDYFFTRNAAATSRFGKKGSAIKISDVKRELKDLHGLAQAQVMSNLTYLIDRGWVKTVDQTKSVSTGRGTTIPSVVTFYEVSALGIELIEGESLFQPKERYPGINVQATGSNVITLGDGNLVNARYESTADRLAALKEALVLSDSLDDALKLDAAVDIETIRDQLAKPDPDRTVIAALWPRVSKVADAAGLASLALQVGELLRPLLG